MAEPLTIDEARKSLNAHVADKGAAICQHYGPRLDFQGLLTLLNNRDHVRYPCELRFDAAPLQPGEFAYPVPNGETPQEGFVMCVHPVFRRCLDLVPALVLYQLVVVNYGDLASADDAETFGSAALGMSKADYYQTVCDLAQMVDGQTASASGSESSKACVPLTTLLPNQSKIETTQNQ